MATSLGSSTGVSSKLTLDPLGNPEIVGVSAPHPNRMGCDALPACGRWPNTESSLGLLRWLAVVANGSQPTPAAGRRLQITGGPNSAPESSHRSRETTVS